MTNWLEPTGLVLNFVGTLLLIWKGLPNLITLSSGAYTEIDKTPEIRAARRWSRAGLVLLALGFGLQLLAAWLPGDPINAPGSAQTTWATRVPVVLLVLVGVLAPFVIEGCLAPWMSQCRHGVFGLSVLYIGLAGSVLILLLEVALDYGGFDKQPVIEAWWQLVIIFTTLLPVAMAAYWLQRWSEINRHEFNEGRRHSCKNGDESNGER